MQEEIVFSFTKKLILSYAMDSTVSKDKIYHPSYPLYDYILIIKYGVKWVNECSTFPNA